MTLRRMILLVGVAALIAGVIALLVPVSVAGPDTEKISCGNAIAADLSAAKEANDRTGANIPILGEVLAHTDYVASCESALSTRRAWSIPLAVVGAVAVGGALLMSRTRAGGGGVLTE